MSRYISKLAREQVKNKYGGLCAYTGTPLEDDWQIDHIVPVIAHELSGIGDSNHIDNLVPCQRIINHYKRGLPLEEFRAWFLSGLHERLKKLPKNPNARKSIRRKEYLIKVAGYFGITPEKPFCGKFYFETL